MYTHTIKATEAARSFSEILNQVRYQGRTFDIKRGKEIVARVSPVTPVAKLSVLELNSFMQSLPQLVEADLDVFESELKDIRKQTGLPKDPWG